MVSSMATVFLPILAVSLGILVVLQRLTSHGSAPGPWINRISAVPAALMLLIGRQHCYYKRLHTKYGPIVRVSPSEVSFSDAAAWDEIYGHRKGRPMEKSPEFIGVVSPLQGAVGIGLAKGKEHARQRKVMAPGLSKKALYGQEPVIQTHVAKLMAVLRTMDMREETANVADWFSYVTFDIMGDLCFREPFGCLDRGTATEWSASIINVLVSGTWDQAIRRVAGVDTFLQRLMVRMFVPSEAARWRRLHLQKTTEKTLRRLSNNDSGHQDIMYQVLRNEDSKNSLNSTEVILNMSLFLAAGSGTTSLLLTAWSWLICTHEEAYTQLVKEVRDAFPVYGDMRLETVMGLPYLGATVAEALRLFPPAAMSQQRTVPPEGAIVQGHHLPGGTTVSMSPWASARSPSNFHEPDQFRPERWLGRGPACSKDKLNASQAFGYGPRVCLGQNLTYLITNLTICRLLVEFDLELDRNRAEENGRWTLEAEPDFIKSYMALTKPDLWVRCKPRAA